METQLKKAFRELAGGLGQAVAERTILRQTDGKWENWGDVAARVALGNCSLSDKVGQEEQKDLEKHIAKATILMSGRHLQHGDEIQPTRNQEVFTNCATAATSSLSFYLLLNGSGVGRSYDDDLMILDWQKGPRIHVTLSHHHKDCDGTFNTLQEKLNELANKGVARQFVAVHLVEDSREGWAHALEKWENLCLDNPRDHTDLILDFSAIRPKGSPIKGMQGRPATGPVPTMQAFVDAYAVVKANHPRWLEAMLIDHVFAACVVMGGARRSARIAVKHWRDLDIFRFVKAKDEFQMWSANNSVGVDDEFWMCLERGDEDVVQLFEEITESMHRSGEPGFINLHKLTNKGMPSELPKVGSAKYPLTNLSTILLQQIFERCKSKTYHLIVNPCAEIALAVWGGFCVIADVVPFHADDLLEVQDACVLATRALMRVNLMPSIYAGEVQRTNRIGVGLTGIHEFAWKFFKCGFRDLLDEKKSKNFWDWMEWMSHCVVTEAETYALELGVNEPHTCLTVKPAGTTSKLFGLTEGAHLPKAATYLRWVQFTHVDPLLKEHEKSGLPIQDLGANRGVSVVGFPTALAIADLGMGEKLVCASEATPEEQFEYLRLLEKHWLGTTHANQISMTLKFNPKTVNLGQFQEIIQKNQPTIRACSVLPDTDEEELRKIYGYTPEQTISVEDFWKIISGIKSITKEDIDKVHVDCQNGACPVDFVK